MENITLFFFNIVPGVLLILVLEAKSNIKILSNVLRTDSRLDLYIFWLIIFSIFIGFFLQAATKYIKEKFLYEVIFCKIKNDDPENYKRAENYLAEKELLSGTTGKKRVEKIFFTMDNYISLGGAGRLLPHFASRLAYWSNLFWVSLIVIVLTLLQNINDNTIIGGSIVVSIISIYESWVHLKHHYDIVLRTFMSYVNIDKKKSESLSSKKKLDKISA